MKTIFLLTILLLSSPAIGHDVLVRIHQPDCALGETQWEVEFNGATRKVFVPTWHEGECVFAGVVDPGVPIEIMAWALRDGEKSGPSKPLVWVPEPEIWLGLMFGIGLLVVLNKRRRDAND